MVMHFHFYFFFIQGEYDNTERIKQRYGWNSPSWISFLKNFKSAAKYEERLLDFLKFADEKNSDTLSDSLTSCLIEYFDVRRAERRDEGPRYCGTTLRGWFSMFLKFWMYTGLGDLRQKAPILENNIGKWEKAQVVVKAVTFEKDDLGW